jgi:putative phosphoribosyl transferase
LRFADRREAGAVLASKLTRYADLQNAVVLALPRGGVPIGFEVAQRLHAPLDIFLVRKLGLPGHPEYAMGAIATGGVRVLNEEAIGWYRVPESVIEAVIAEEQTELARREAVYRDGRPAVSIDGRIAIIVDDGLATGASMRAAVTAVRQLEPAQVVVAVPVGAPSTCAEMRQLADEVVCARTPEPFNAVGLWYDDFSQTSDEEVQSLLRAHDESLRATGGVR